MPRYHFDEFVLSPRQRLLLRGGTEQQIIPRYFDLLLLLIERRGEAVHRQEIFERVWGDVIVSESALSQAVRTIRRTLGDDSKEPRFIRTVSRHGYRFVFAGVIEEEDDDSPWVTVQPGPPTAAGAAERRQAVELSPVVRTSAGGGLAGVVAGFVGGLILAAAPESTAPLALAPVLAVIGGGCGALGGVGVGAGLALAEKVASGPRIAIMTGGAAVGAGAVGIAVQWLTRWALASLVGLDINIGGALEGLVIGGAAGLGLAIGIRNAEDASSVTVARSRLKVALVTAVCCGLAGLAISFTGRPLAGGTIHVIADAAEGSRATLAPLGRLIGEPDFGRVTSAILAFGEAATFGFGIAYGLIRRASPGEAP